MEPRAHVTPDGELGRPDGMGLVHLAAADLCHPDTGMVLQQVRGDDTSCMKKTSRLTRPAQSPDHPCPKCGSTEFSGEEDVLDTWMDSSISVLNVTGWDGTGNPAYFPAQIRPQGHDIIRTWAFYTILRSVALTGKAPWDEILVNGMVLGEDGFKMSKSRGNIIEPL